MKSYNTLNDYYRKLFGEKTFKVPIDAGFDCPNRDGTVAHGGCTFCTVSGSGDAIVAPDAPIRIGTRPDCLPDETIEYLAELSECMHVTVELGLQTTYEATSDLINRVHSYEL
ncbi:hypothetical protein G9Q02_27755 [Klebsiella pneumoniae]|nr:hypothetical protein [Klebsiella pneumoniae]